MSLFDSLFVDFDREIGSASLKIYLSPATPFKTNKGGSQLELIPLSAWRPETRYRISIVESYTSREVAVVNFTTMSKDTKSKDTGPDPGYIIDEEERVKNLSPETFLMNRLPWENELISISGDYDKTVSDFVFIVTSKSKDSCEARIEMQKFLADLGISAEAVKKLRIEYR